MKNIYLLISGTVSLYLSILLVLMMIRMFMSFLISDEMSKPKMFIYGATEPVIYPVRYFLMKFEFFQSIPIDFSVTITSFILWIVTLSI